MIKDDQAATAGQGSRQYPLQATPFFGRERELTDILERLTDPSCRLLSLIGPGGIGKTRLAMELTSRLDDSVHFPEGAHLIPLQSVTEREFLPGSIAQALHLGLSGAEDPATQLIHHLRDKRLLLVLDNVEQLAETDSLDLIVKLLQAAPKLKVLTTSRQVLQLRQEWRYPLQGLPVPDNEDINEAEAFDAVRLFITCAERVQPDFEAADELADIVRICRLVGGMPLAIELAAGWRSTLDCQSIVEEVEHGFEILHTEMRDMPARHRSMRAVFDHTWRSLTQQVQSAFARLSVFRGGFRREAAERVADASLSSLNRLVDQSLLRCRADGRYDLHELLRQYGAEKLSSSPSAEAELQRRHALYYAGFLHRRIERIHGPDQRQAFGEIDAELQNVRAAWRWSVNQANVGAIQQAATTYFLYCQQKCTYLEGADALAQAAASLDKQPSTPQRDRALAQLFNHEGWLRIRVGEFRKAESLLERSCSLYQDLGTPPPPYMGGASEAPLALVAVIKGDLDRAVRLAESVRQSSEEQDDRHNLAFAHYALSAARLAVGDYEDAQQHAQESAALARSLGNRWFLGYPLNEWGKAALALGERAEARRQFQASFAIKKEFNDAEGMAVALNHLGEIARLQGEFSEAQQAFERSLSIYRTLNDRGGLATSYRGLAKVALSLGEFEQARKYFIEALKISTDIHYLPLIFSLLVDVQPLLRQRDHRALGAQLLAFVQRHPASDHEARMRATDQLDSCERQMPPQDYAEALQAGEGWNLDSAIAALQGPLSIPLTETEPEAAHEQDLIEPLTPREQEVLALIAEGRANAHIAEELVLAVGTVKWYASEIYGKLGVTNRTEAAARARELGLL